MASNVLFFDSSASWLDCFTNGQMDLPLYTLPNTMDTHVQLGNSVILMRDSALVKQTLPWHLKVCAISVAPHAHSAPNGNMSHRHCRMEASAHEPVLTMCSYSLSA